MIHFFGDSFTYGQGCTSDHEYYKRTYNGTQKTWVELVSEHIGDIHLNYGNPGGGNDKILDTLQKNLFRIKSNDIVFLSRTHDERLQTPYENSGFKDIIPGMLMNNNEVYDMINEHDYYQSIENYIKFVNFPNFNAIKNRFDVLYISYHRFFEENNIKCIQWRVDDHTLDNDGNAKYSIISDEIPEINDSHWSWKGHHEFFNFIKNEL